MITNSNNAQAGERCNREFGFCDAEIELSRI